MVMKYVHANKHQVDARIFRHILNDYLVCKERNLVSALISLEEEIAQWLNRVGGMAGEW